MIFVLFYTSAIPICFVFVELTGTMHCIQFRPSTRFFQAATVVDVPRGETSAVQETSLKDVRSGLSKDDRLAHVESLRSIFVHVILPKDVVGHIWGGNASAILPDVLSTGFGSPEVQKKLGGCSDLELAFSLPSVANVSQAISMIFDTWIALEKRNGRAGVLHQNSLYSKISSTVDGVNGISSDLMALAMLQSDLSLGICDAAGSVLQSLKRVYSPKGPSTLQIEQLPSTPTVGQLAQLFQTRHCQAFGLAPSQKTLLTILSSFVEANGVVNQEAAFQPPFS